MITTINEYRQIVEQLNTFSLTIPKESEWIYDEDNNRYGISKFENIFWIQNKDLDFIKKHIGDTISFKYNKEYKNIIYPQLLTNIKENNDIS